MGTPRQLGSAGGRGTPQITPHRQWRAGYGQAWRTRCPDASREQQCRTGAPVAPLPSHSPALTVEPAGVVLLSADGGTPAQAAEDGKVTAHQIGGHPRVELLAWQAPREALQGTPWHPPAVLPPRHQAQLSLTHKDGGSCMPGVVRALPLAILSTPGVQLEGGLLEGNKNRRRVGSGSRGLQQCWGGGSPPHAGRPPRRHRRGGRRQCHRRTGGSGCRSAGSSRSSCTQPGGGRHREAVLERPPLVPPGTPSAPPGTHSDVLARPVALLPPLHWCRPVDL